ncbi:MAG: transmembrane protein, distant homology with ydbS, partial [uncultured Thermomicrobiales bacterium]
VRPETALGRSTRAAAPPRSEGEDPLALERADGVRGAAGIRRGRRLGHVPARPRLGVVGDPGGGRAPDRNDHGRAGAGVALEPVAVRDRRAGGGPPARVADRDPDLDPDDSDPARRHPPQPAPAPLRPVQRDPLHRGRRDRGPRPRRRHRRLRPRPDRGAGEHAGRLAV